MRPDPILRSGRERTVPLTVPPRRDALVCLPADFGRRFTVSVDTEEAFDWTGPFCRDGHHNRAIAALPRFQQRMEAAGVKPLYLVNHAVAADPEAAAVLRSIHSGGKASVGTHLHPWNTPPFEERVTRRNSFAGNLP